MRTDALYKTLRKAAFHRRLTRTLRSFLWAAAVVPVWFLLWFAADNLLNLSPLSRQMCMAVTGLSCVGLVAVLWLRDWRTGSDAEATAVYLEQRYGIGDNSLVNAVCFDRDPNVPQFARDALKAGAEKVCGGVRFGAIWKQAHLKRACEALGVGVLLFLGYAIPFGSHASNALERFLNPSTSLMPIDATQFEVSPGDKEVAEGSTCLVKAKAIKFGKPAQNVEILVKNGGAPILSSMRAQEDGFAFELTAQAGVTQYALRNGNDQTRWYALTAAPRPRTDRLAIVVTPPEYTGVKAWTLAPSRRECAVLKGSTFSVDAERLDGDRFAFYVGDKAAAPSNAFACVVKEDLPLSLDVTDRRGFTHTRAWSCSVKAEDDRVPSVRFDNKEMNVEGHIGDTLTLELEMSDDYGLTALELFTKQQDKEIVLKRLDYRELRTNRVESCRIPVDGKIFVRNATYRIGARAFDTRPQPQIGLAAVPLSLHIVDAAGVNDEASGNRFARLFAQLNKALEAQKSTRDWLAPKVESWRQPQMGTDLLLRQIEVHSAVTQGVAMAKGMLQAGVVHKGLGNQIVELDAGLSFPLLQRINALGRAKDDGRKAELNGVILGQSRLITVLQQILGVVEQARQQEDKHQDALAKEEQDQALIKKLEALKKEVSAFKEDETRLLKGLEAIDKKDPEDWTDAEEKLLGDLAAKQQDWAKFFKAAFNDLSKLENQDFSNSTMADEFIELFEELQKSGEALERKHIEIATVNEELMGQQADSIQANLERWLSDTKDFIKWNGEEAGITPDVPLQDLPEELTDIMGELIDSADEMEDVEDSSNSSLSAFDDGIGWGVSDGNMDDMSAKGITGNVLPNNNEVGGRSGEGRSGKSSGQFVEKEAHGKGGRDTPTRLTQSPFEKGTVKDTSKDPQGGATGGGKQSGIGGEGLRGITPSQKTDTQERLPGQQAEMKQKAEALMRELNVRNLPTGDLEDAINKMDLIQKYRSAGQGLQVRQVQSDLAARLRDARAAVESKAAKDAVERRAVSRGAADAVRYEAHEKTPEGYEDSVGAYFKRLASPEE